MSDQKRRSGKRAVTSGSPQKPGAAGKEQPRNPSDRSDVPYHEVRARVEQQYLVAIWDDLDIWRHQEYGEHPALSWVDAKPYMGLRKWAMQFYDERPRPKGAGFGVTLQLAELTGHHDGHHGAWVGVCRGLRLNRRPAIPQRSAPKGDVWIPRSPRCG